MRLLFAILLLVSLPALSAVQIYRFDTPEQEQRFNTLGKELRCLVCQGQAIGDSNSDLANDLKAEVHRMILEGKSDADIIDFMVARYGDFVLFRPPVNGMTYLLWFGPGVLLIVGLMVALRLVRRTAAPAAEPDAAALARARALLNEQAPEDRP
jgi:cytochrome c-type biogenesis protein CcmH